MLSRHLTGGDFWNTFRGSTPESTAWRTKVIRLMAEDYHIEKTGHLSHPTQGERPTSYLPYIVCTLALPPARIPAVASLADISSTSGSSASVSAWTQSRRKLLNAMLPNIPVPLPSFTLSCFHPDFFFHDSAQISVNPSQLIPVTLLVTCNSIPSKSDSR